MSKINSLKQKYPELGMSIIDLLIRMDNTKTNKYLPLLCKLFSSKFNNVESYISIEEIKSNLIGRGINVDNLTQEEILFICSIIDIFPYDNFLYFKDFKSYVERDLIDNKDVLTYSSLNELKKAVSLAQIKTLSKELEKQVHKFYEDEIWTIVRPLTFESSLKYGSNTKWCTTYINEKQYFTRYWSTGILAYIINRKNGTKYAMYRSLKQGEKKELSFWDASDNRIDFLELEIDENLYTIVKQLTKSEKTNEELCDEELIETVWKECDFSELLRRKSMDLTCDVKFSELNLTLPLPEVDVTETDEEILTPLDRRQLLSELTGEVPTRQPEYYAGYSVTSRRSENDHENYNDAQAG